MERLSLKYIILLLLFFSMPFSLLAQNGAIRKVVIDAGHGGRDPGAPGKILNEKDIVLSIALKLGAYIKENFEDVEVIYTRTTDVFVELHKRAAIANENNADLFISIHCNSNRSSKPYGSETFVMGTHKNQANLEVAKKENASILLEDDYSTQYDGFDPNSPEANIIFSLYQNKYLEQSATLATYVQKQFRERVKRHDRGVKQAGFLVLYRTTMPSILVEAGFLSNPTEGNFLASEKGQVYIASAIYRAFKEYKLLVENNIVNEEELTAMPVPFDSEVAATATESDEQLVFRVQVVSSPKKLSLKSMRLKGLHDVFEYKDGKVYKYTVGEYDSISEALQGLKKIKAEGFADAFVISFYNGKRIPMNEARQILKNRK